MLPSIFDLGVSKKNVVRKPQRKYNVNMIIINLKIFMNALLNEKKVKGIDKKKFL